VIADCSDLLQCEARLAPEAARVNLLGQIALTQEDIAHLARLIREKLAPDMPAGTRLLRAEAPTCLACFLVWMGIVGYREGDYWSAVQESLGLELDANRQARLGQSFLAFLRDRGLPNPDIEGSHPYVTPILLHGGIPNSCLGKFFEQVVLPLVRRDLIDPSDPEEIVEELAVRRQEDEERAETERQRATLRKKASSLKRQIKLLRQAVDAYDGVLALWRLEEKAAQIDLTGLPDDLAAFQERRNEELGRLDRGIQALQQRQAGCQHTMAAFTQRDRRVLAQATEIERCVSGYPRLREHIQQADLLEIQARELAERAANQSKGILAQPWQDEYGEQLLQLPLDELEEEIVRLEAVVSQQSEAQEALDQHTVLQKTPSRGQQLLPYALALLALVLILLGTAVLSSWLLTVAGFGLIIVAGFTGWARRRKRVKLQREREALESDLRDLKAQHRTAQESIAGLLRDLSLSPRQVHSPSMELHQALGSLAGMYGELKGIRKRREELLQHIQPQMQSAQRLMAALDVQPTPSLDDAVTGMKRDLRKAQERQQAAVQAQMDLENRIRPQVATLSAQKQALINELATLEERLADLGEGDVQAGIERVQTQHQVLRDARQRRAALEEEYPDLEAIEHKIRDAQSKDALSHEANQMEAQRKDISAQIRVLTAELKHHLSAFPGVDDPICRYLLHGGTPAEDFLVGSVSLLFRTLSDGEIPGREEVDLPDRVVAGFEEWWDEYSRREPRGTDDLGEAARPGGQRFRTPIILLDPVAVEVMASLPVQRYSASLGGSVASMEVLGVRSEMRQACDLHLYEGAAGLVETQDREIRLLFPDRRYEFNLKSKGRLIRQWEITGIRGEEPYMAFEWRSGKLIRKEPLPQTRVWFLTRCGSTLGPAQAVLVEQVPLLDQWEEYGFFELDLSGVDQLKVINGQGQHFHIPVSAEVSSDLGLVSGQLLEDVDSEGSSVYVGPPPCVRIPIEDRAELRGGRLSIASDMDDDSPERKHFRLSDLGNALEISPDSRWVDVLLADEMLLGRHPLGRFTIWLRKRPHTKWTATICIVPDLRVRFDQVLYAPRKAGKQSSIRASVAVDEDMEFVPRPPAEILKSEPRYTIRIDRGEDALRGLLCRRGERETGVPLTVTIPKVRWRLQGLEEVQQDVWHDTVEEVWLGYWETAADLFLVVALPSYIEGSLCLSLGDHVRREDRKPLRDGKARFDLRAFGETFLTGPALQTFSLTLSDSPFGLDDTPLLSVRTRWEVDELVWDQEPRGRGMNLLTVTWTEKGKRGGKERIVRLWSLEGTGSEPLMEQKVPEGEHRVTFEARVATVPPGKYLLQVALQDPWDPPQPSCPSPDDPNTQIIEIVSKEDTWQGKMLCLCSIVDDEGQVHELEPGIYQIRISGASSRRLPIRTLDKGVDIPTSKGWFKGSLEVPPGTGLETEIAGTNPVRLEYDASQDRVTSIEDRDGDGAMYCLDCCRLYWKQETLIEEQKKHRIIGPIEAFGVSWE